MVFICVFRSRSSLLPTKHSNTHELRGRGRSIPQTRAHRSQRTACTQCSHCIPKTTFLWAQVCPSFLLGPRHAPADVQSLPPAACTPRCSRRALPSSTVSAFWHRWKSPSHGTGMEPPKMHWEVCIKITEHIQKSSKWLSTGRSAQRGWFCSPAEGHQKSHRHSTCPRCPFHSKAAAFSWRGTARGNDDSAIKASTRRQETQVC